MPSFLHVAKPSEAKNPRDPISYPSPVLKLFCSSLIWPNYQVRTVAAEVLRKLCVVEGLKFRSALAECLLEATNDGLLDEVYNKASGVKQSAENYEPKNVPSGFFANILTNLLPEKKANWETDAEVINFLVSSLFFSSASRVVEEHGAIWISWIAKYPEIGDFVHSDAFCEAVFDRVLKCSDKILRRNVIRLLLSIHFKNSKGDDTGAFVADRFWTRFTQDLFSLDQKQYLEVTKDQAGVFNTSEGELYNVNVIEESSDSNLDGKNLKRENKAYSHKDQLAEIEIRKALAEKNRREGKLTDRQKKAIAAEMKSESEIRNRLKELYDKAEILLTVLAEAARYNPQGACYHVTVLYEVVVPLLRSHLVSGLACETFLAFSDAFFEPSSDNLGCLVGTAALRVLNALNYGDVHWEESLVDQLTRVFKSLASLCIFIDIPIDEEFHDDENMLDVISAWKLSFLIPVIEKLLPSNYPMEFKLRVSQFLKSAINGNFLSASDIILPPIVRLHTFLI
uniref:Uncharacterized protein n=1 Tax=Panagrolaimus superbus TaxID=310955 RepID=A0A914YDF9_9BILA